MTLIYSQSDSPRHRPVPAVGREYSEDSKLTKDPKGHPCSSTAVSQHSCDESCPFIGGACYASVGNMAYTTRRLNTWDRDHESTPEEIATAEAARVRGLSGQHPLRLHTVGDCRTDEAARIVSEAAEAHHNRYGAPVWTYTHAWRVVDRASWGTVSVLASCETAQDVTLATARGYATALVYNKKDGTPDDIDGMKVIPCREQTGEAPDCVRCTNVGPLCAMDEKLRGRRIIGLAGHGATVKVSLALASRKGE